MQFLNTHRRAALAACAFLTGALPGLVFADEPASAGKAPVAATLVTSSAPPARPFTSVSGLKAEMARLKAKIAARREAVEKKNGKSAAEGDKGQKEDGLGYIESLLWRVQLRAFPRDTVDAEAYRRAAQHRLRMPGSQLGCLLYTSPSPRD